MTNRLVWRRSNQLIELFAVENERVVAMSQYATFHCNTASCVDVVTSHHANCYTWPLTLADGIRNLHMTHEQSVMILALGWLMYTLSALPHALLYCMLYATCYRLKSTHDYCRKEPNCCWNITTEQSSEDELTHLWSDRIFNSNNTNTCQVWNDGVFIVPVWLWRHQLVIRVCSTYTQQNNPLVILFFSNAILGGHWTQLNQTHIS